ncbi:MAG: hypothetical protein QOH14_3105 [Pseudonocardiales bacterium]|jgi:hypothetical protein|nr:hypothetical protein [Pseudonocardiales bacterium]
MRVASDTRQLAVDPGGTAAVVLEVVNTGEVIDGITARVIGLPDQLVSSQPALLPLFPDASGQLTLSLSVPQTHPAGRHPLTVEVVSHGARLPSQFVDVDMDVSARPAMRLAALPRVIRARRSGRFVFELTNEGNVPLDVTLRAADADRSSRTEFAPGSVRLEAGAVAPVLLTVRGPRMFTGAEIDRTVSVEAVARRAEALTAAPAESVIETEPPLIRETSVRLRQRPLVSRGLLTALILVGIVALWAGVFLLGLTKVFSGDPMTKSAPASFFAASAGGSGSGGSSGAGGTGGTGAAGAGGTGAGAAPAGALSKTGQLPPGMGGEITGSVNAANDQQPVGRILVEAIRIGRKGPVVVSSAATQADGSYTLAGLFPTSYYIKFSASGFRPQWYPGAASQNAGQLVTAVAQGTTKGVNAIVKGNPASISGKVNPGDTLTPVTTTVTARPLLGADTGKAIATTTTSAAGQYTLPNLPAPGSYQLTFTTPGYQASTVVDTVSGGDERLEPTVTLGASTGQISGTVADKGAALGGATISTTVGGKALTVITPTTGQVGAFVLGNLPTPATYVITFSAPGHGSVTTIVDLTAGQSRAGLTADLAAGTGSVTGRLVDAAGNGLGGATVTVGGATSSTSGATAGTAPTTTTLTSGSVGSFAINGLTAPGAYTLTFTLAGYSPASVPVTLKDNGAPPNVLVTLTTQLGSISGTVSAPGGAAQIGATITATNGHRSWTATSSAAGGALPSGGYLISGLEPGTYSVTVTAPGRSQQTAMVTVVAGRTTRQNLLVGG